MGVLVKQGVERKAAAEDEGVIAARRSLRVAKRHVREDQALAHELTSGEAAAANNKALIF